MTAAVTRFPFPGTRSGELLARVVLSLQAMSVAVPKLRRLEGPSLADLAATRLVPMTVWPVPPTDDLRYLPRAPQVLRWDLARDQDFATAWIVGMHDHAGRLGGRHGCVWPGVVAPAHFLRVGDHKVDRDKPRGTEPTKLSQPLMRREVAGKNGHRVVARDSVRDARRLYPAVADRSLVLCPRKMREPRHAARLSTAPAPA